ncbi:flagellar hook-associated protein 2 [Clostridia bacterium]|nr:flagellar hook-associated protein 2 [Clostridia bacterium]
MNINSSTQATTSSSSAVSSNGLSGFSGIDTDSMVEKMLTTAQSKLNAQKAKEQQLTWKQDLYRDIVDKINTFSDKYFSASSSTYLGNTNLYQINKINSSSSAVSVSTTSTTAGQASSVQVASLATASSVAGSKLSSGITSNVADAFKTSDADYDVTFTFGIPKDADGDGSHDLNSNKVLQFDELGITVNLKGANTEQEKVDRINEAIAKKAFGDDAVFDTGTGKWQDGADTTNGDSRLINSQNGELVISMGIDSKTNGLSYEGTWGLKIGASSGAKGLQALGLTAEQKSISSFKDADASFSGLTFQDGGKTKYASYKFTGSDLSQADALYNIKVNLDGVAKTFSYSAQTIEEMKSYQDTINSTDPTVTTAQKDAAQAKIDNFYNDLSTNLSKAFGLSVKGEYDAANGQFKITTGDGQKVTLTGDTSVLGIKSGASTSFALSTKLSNLMGFVGEDVQATEADGTLKWEDENETIPTMTKTTTDYSFKINDVTIKLDSNKTVQDLINTVNKSAAGVTMSYNSITDSFNIVNDATGASAAITLGDTTTTADLIAQKRTQLNSDLTTAQNELTGLTPGNTDYIDKENEILDLQTKLGLDDNTLFGQMKSDAQATIADPWATDAEIAQARKILDTSDKGLLETLKLTGSGTKVTEGKNAIVNIDGQVLQRTSNTFKIGDITYTLNSTTGNYDLAGDKQANGDWAVNSGTDAKAKVTYSQASTDAAVSTLKSFVEDYNKLIEDLNKEISSDASYKKYPPLSDTQKKEMSEKEIENWETAAKVGLLRNDAEISNFLQNMRESLNKSFGNVTLDAIGISTSSNWASKGKLEVDETKLRSALEKHGNEIFEMLRGKDGRSGLVADLLKNVKKTASKSSGEPGTLVRIAGVKGYGTEKNNEIYKKLLSFTDKIKRLQEQYDKRKEMLWAQFNAMETAMSNMNTQAGWLGQQ